MQLTRIIKIAVLALLVGNGTMAVAQTHRRGVDFRNFTYPGIWQRGSFRLRNGKAKFEFRNSITEYTFRGVRYVDLTGDGIKEALVSVEDLSASGSSSLSNYYYIYSLRSGPPRLLWKFSTGSESYAGLMNFHVRGRKLVFELFGNYRIANSKPAAVSYPKNISDIYAEQYTRLTVAWNGARFVTVRRQVFPFPYKTIREYEQSRGR